MANPLREVSPVRPAIDVGHEHYPFCVVWTPIPLLTWILPFVGHIAICDSQGRIYDFQGDFTIGDDRMLFGNPTMYWDVSKFFIPSMYSRPPLGDTEKGSESSAVAAQIQREINEYDQAIFNAIEHFRRSERYSFCTNNCHCFVASALNLQPLTKKTNNMVTVCFRMALHGRYVNCSRFVKSILPFTILTACAVVLIVVLS